MPSTDVWEVRVTWAEVYRKFQAHARRRTTPEAAWIALSEFGDTEGEALAKGTSFAYRQGATHVWTLYEASEASKHYRR